MQYRVFTVSLTAGPAGSEELNLFLRSHRVLAVERRLIEDGVNSLWTFCVEYLDGIAATSFKPDVRVDYKEVLTPVEFARFSRLRELRKTLAEQETVPPYAVFTNEQLAALVRLDRPTKLAMAAVPGIGEAKVAKYGERFLAELETLNKATKNEASGKSDGGDR
jgi:superfamily II DNA helicase RecQ